MMDGETKTHLSYNDSISYNEEERNRISVRTTYQHEDLTHTVEERNREYTCASLVVSLAVSYSATVISEWLHVELE